MILAAFTHIPVKSIVAVFITLTIQKLQTHTQKIYMKKQNKNVIIKVKRNSLVILAALVELQLESKEGFYQANI